MWQVLVVGVGGFIGSVMRYGANTLFAASAFPLSTLIVNIVGSFIIGFASEFIKEGLLPFPNAALFIQTGLCGGFTTFSAFSLETMTLFKEAHYLQAGLYILLSVGLCLAGCILGILCAQLVKKSLAA